MLMMLLAAMSLAGEPAKVKDISGTWVPIGEHEAGNKRVRVGGCWSTRTTWVVSTSGKAITATLNPGHSTPGAAPVDFYRHAAEVTGGWSKDALVLQGRKTITHTRMGQPDYREVTKTKLRFEFTVERETGHLVGSLNGEPVRWAPEDTSPQEARECGNPPA